ncbi:MAG TPA: OsmC family protein [Sphingomicrobium sp.]|nr:OsmC family protein [Sphingomicrobium sp.]
MLDTVKSRVNGLDLAALGEVVDAIEADPSQALAGFEVTTRWTGQTRSESEVEGFTLGGQRIARSHRIVADEPCELLGSDGAPNPQELLMSAVNACMMVGYVAGASLKGITLDSLEIHTRGTLDLRGFLGLDDSVPPGYQSIDYDVRIKGDGSPEQFEEIHQTVMKTSPNYFNISRPVRMNGTLHVG